MKQFRIIGLIIGVFAFFQTQARSAERIVSLAPSLTKNIYYLNAQEQLVGCTSYCTEALAENKEVVGSAVKINIEKLLSLKPDIIFTTPLTDPETIDLLKKFDIQIEIFPSATSFEGICDQFIEIGKLLDKEEKAQRIIADAKIRVEKLQESVRTINKEKFFFQIGADPIFTVLPNTFMNDYILLANGTNIASDLTKGTMTRESVIARDPSYIFVVTMGIVGEEELDTWKKFEALKAAKDNHIFVIDAEKACSPTPITFVETFETIIQLMQQ